MGDLYYLYNDSSYLFIVMFIFFLNEYGGGLFEKNSYGGGPFLFSFYEVYEGNNKTLLFSFLVVLGGDFVIILLYIG